MVLTRFICRLALAFILIASAAGMVLPQKSLSTTKGTLERIKVHGKSLEANLEGETADPDISIYLVVFKIMKRPAPPLPLLACRFQ